MPTRLTRPLVVAAMLQIERDERRAHPAGSFDGGSRWYPSSDEWRPCCGSIRRPSRAWPHTLNQHCRTTGHVAALHGVPVTDLRKTINLALLLCSPLVDLADVEKALLAATRKRTPVTTEQIRGAIKRRQPVSLHRDLDSVVDRAIALTDPLVEQLLAANVDPARVLALAAASRA